MALKPHSTLPFTIMATTPIRKDAAMEISVMREEICPPAAEERLRRMKFRIKCVLPA